MKRAWRFAGWLVAPLVVGVGVSVVIGLFSLVPDPPLWVSQVIALALLVLIIVYWAHLAWEFSE